MRRLADIGVCKSESERTCKSGVVAAVSFDVLNTQSSPVCHLKNGEEIDREGESERERERE